MFIKEIELKNFRNYEDLKAQFHKNVNIFLGQNAQGKTNLLESIYINSFGKSFRTNREKDLIKFDKEYCRVKTSIEKEDDEIVVEIAINKEGKKGIKIDGAKITKMADLLETIFIVVFSPEDLKIVKDEPEKRRRFIDRELCQLKFSYYDNLRNYKKVLVQRNAYLKEREIDENIIDIWDIKLAEYGADIILQRNLFIQKINLISRDIHSKITNSKENLHISYEPNIEICADKKSQIEHFYEVLKDCRSNDIKMRTTKKGPHKDDLKISADDIDIRHFGSQGQQRTAALSLKLSEIKLIKEETDETPVLLLDDVLSELDHQRQKFLISSLEDTQIFITTTEISKELQDALPEGKTFLIKEGTL